MVSIIKVNECVVDPEVFFGATEQHIRRHEGKDKVIGALVGSRSDDGTLVHVKNAFPLEFSGGETIVNVDFLHQMYNLHCKVHHRDILVGWYSTGCKLDKDSAKIHDSISNEFPESELVHLMIDSALEKNEGAIKAFVSVPLNQESSQSLGIYFHEIPLELKYFDSEKSGLSLIYGTQETLCTSIGFMSEVDLFKKEISKLQTNLKIIQNYVSSVVKGKTKGNSQIGRYLMDVVNSMPTTSSINIQTNDKIIQKVDDIQDVYDLIKLTMGQMQVVDKMQLIE